MTDNQNQIAVLPDTAAASNLPICSVYSSMQSFENAQRMAKALAASNLVPTDYQGNTANTLIALEMSHRTGSSPMAVMQNMHVIHGRPSWSSQFVIAALNSCGRFSHLRYRVTDLGTKEVKYEEWQGPKGQRSKVTKTATVHDKECVAWAYDRATGDVLEGPPVSIGLAVAEGWYSKDGSKWVTMPDLMLRYRASKFFGNLYAPDVLMGMHTADEVEDIGDLPPAAPRSAPIAANDNEPVTSRRSSSLNDFVASQPAAKSQAEESADVFEGEVLPPETPAEEAPKNTRRSRKPKPEPAQEEPPADYSGYPEESIDEPVAQPNSPAPSKDLF